MRYFEAGVSEYLKEKIVELKERGKNPLISPYEMGKVEGELQVIKDIATIAKISV